MIILGIGGILSDAAVALLKDGRIAACGSADEIRRSAQPEVVAFLSGARDSFEEPPAAGRIEQGGLHGS